MDRKVSELLNDQINKEFYSAYLYLDIANFYSDKGLDGFANWYEIQAREEQDHAMLIYQYLHNNNQKVTLEAGQGVLHADGPAAGRIRARTVRHRINQRHLWGRPVGK